MFRKIMNTFCKVLVYIIAFIVAALMGIMLVHILKESIPALSEVGIKMFFPSSEWRPVSAVPQYGLLPAITGTLYVSGLAVLLALVFGVACACFLTFFMPEKLAAVCLAFIDLVAGIPSVIFGFIGLTVLVKAFAKYLKMAAGQCVLAAGIVLGIMLLPYVISTCQESLVNAKRTYEKSGLALGLSREYVLIKVILPAIRPGIIASAMMAFGRALGETMAVMMVIGNSAIFPKLLGWGQTLPALMGSIYLGALSALMGGIIGIGVAVYLVFYTGNGIFYHVISTCITGLSGIPSILFGLVGYTLLIYQFGMGRSLLCSSICVAVMIVPFIAIRAEKIFQEKGTEYMKNSLALGISREYAVVRQILPVCGVELLGTVALGMAYGMGAVAPILYTGAVMVADVPGKLTDPFMSLPYHLYMLVNNGFSLDYAYGTAFVLMLFLLIIQVVCKCITYIRRD